MMVNCQICGLVAEAFVLMQDPDTKDPAHPSCIIDKLRKERDLARAEVTYLHGYVAAIEEICGIEKGTES